MKVTLEQAMKAQWRVKVWLYSFFNLGVRGRGGLRHASAASPPGKSPGTHCIGGWVGRMKIGYTNPMVIPTTHQVRFAVVLLHRGVAIVTRLRAGQSGVRIPKETFFSAKTSSQALRFTRSPSRWVPGSLPAAKQPGREANPLTSS